MHSLAVVVPLVAVAAVCQGEELEEHPGLAPAAVLLAAWVLRLGAWHFNDNTEWRCTGIVTLTSYGVKGGALRPLSMPRCSGQISTTPKIGHIIDRNYAQIKGSKVNVTMPSADSLVLASKRLSGSSPATTAIPLAPEVRWAMVRFRRNLSARPLSADEKEAWR
jgi:hypothetical protein